MKRARGGSCCSRAGAGCAVQSSTVGNLSDSHTKTDLETNLGLRPGLFEGGQTRLAAAVPEGTLVKNLPAFEACDWDKATCIHRLQLLYLAFLDPMEKKQIIGEVTRGHVVQGTSSFQSYADDLNYKVQSTDGEVGENEHKRFLIQGSNPAHQQI